MKWVLRFPMILGAVLILFTGLSANFLVDNGNIDCCQVCRCGSKGLVAPAGRPPPQVMLQCDNQNRLSSEISVSLCSGQQDITIHQLAWDGMITELPVPDRIERFATATNGGAQFCQFVVSVNQDDWSPVSCKQSRARIPVLSKSPRDCVSAYLKALQNPGVPIRASPNLLEGG